MVQSETGSKESHRKDRKKPSPATGFRTRIRFEPPLHQRLSILLNQKSAQRTGAAVGFLAGIRKASGTRPPYPPKPGCWPASPRAANLRGVINKKKHSERGAKKFPRSVNSTPSGGGFPPAPPLAPSGAPRHSLRRSEAGVIVLVYNPAIRLL